MNSRFRHVSLFLIASIVLGSSVSSGLAQETTETPSKPLGPEAYEILQSFYDYDRDISLEARVVEKRNRSNCVREKIVIRVGDSMVTTYLAVPQTGSPPYPCVLVLHGITGSKDGWWEDGNFASGGHLTGALLKAGFAVLTPDAPYHGERTFENRFGSAWVMVQKKQTNRFRDVVIRAVIECRRAIDYLETRPQIDGDRIGVVGYSLGGIETFALTALDARVKSSVACVTPAASLDEVGASPAILPRSFAGKLHDRPFLMLMGRNDQFCNADTARRLYDLIPGSQKDLVLYDSGHGLPGEWVSRAAKWLRAGLK